jgi:hypothetical protein
VNRLYVILRDIGEGSEQRAASLLFKCLAKAPYEALGKVSASSGLAKQNTTEIAVIAAQSVRERCHR